MQQALKQQCVVMPGLVPGIHVFLSLLRDRDVDGRVEPGHDAAAIARRYGFRVRASRALE
jgi:hypothetical protein